MSSADEKRLLEILITHNEPVLRVDLACALGITPAEVAELAVKFQKLGYAVLDEDSETVAATPAADAALRGG
jgi:DNA-binding IclR family transcriptional regulator